MCQIDPPERYAENCAANYAENVADHLHFILAHAVQPAALAAHFSL